MNFSIVIHIQALVQPHLKKNHLYPLMISTTFVQFQTSTSFPKFSKKLLPARIQSHFFCLSSLIPVCLPELFILLKLRTLLKIHNDLILTNKHQIVLAMDRGEVISLILLEVSAAFELRYCRSFRLSYSSSKLVWS